MFAQRPSSDDIALLYGAGVLVRDSLEAAELSSLREQAESDSNSDFTSALRIFLYHLHDTFRAPEQKQFNYLCKHFSHSYVCVDEIINQFYKRSDANRDREEGDLFERDFTNGFSSTQLLALDFFEAVNLKRKDLGQENYFCFFRAHLACDRASQVCNHAATKRVLQKEVRQIMLGYVRAWRLASLGKITSGSVFSAIREKLASLQGNNAKITAVLLAVHLLQYVFGHSIDLPVDLSQKIEKIDGYSTLNEMFGSNAEELTKPPIPSGTDMQSHVLHACRAHLLHRITSGVVGRREWDRVTSYEQLWALYQDVRSRCVPAGKAENRCRLYSEYFIGGVFVGLVNDVCPPDEELSGRYRVEYTNAQKEELIRLYFPTAINNSYTREQIRTFLDNPQNKFRWKGLFFLTSQYECDSSSAKGGWFPYLFGERLNQHPELLEKRYFNDEAEPRWFMELGRSPVLTRTPHTKQRKRLYETWQREEFDHGADSIFFKSIERHLAKTAGSRISFTRVPGVPKVTQTEEEGEFLTYDLHIRNGCQRVGDMKSLNDLQVNMSFTFRLESAGYVFEKVDFLGHSHSVKLFKGLFSGKSLEAFFDDRSSLINIAEALRNSNLLFESPNASGNMDFRRSVSSFGQKVANSALAIRTHCLGLQGAFLDVSESDRVGGTSTDWAILYTDASEDISPASPGLEIVNTCDRLTSELLTEGLALLDNCVQSFKDSRSKPPSSDDKRLYEFLVTHLINLVLSLPSSDPALQLRYLVHIANFGILGASDLLTDLKDIRQTMESAVRQVFESAEHSIRFRSGDPGYFLDFVDMVNGALAPISKSAYNAVSNREKRDQILMLFNMIDPYPDHVLPYTQEGQEEVMVPAFLTELSRGLHRQLVSLPSRYNATGEAETLKKRMPVRHWLSRNSPGFRMFRFVFVLLASVGVAALTVFTAGVLAVPAFCIGGVVGSFLGGLASGRKCGDVLGSCYRPKVSVKFDMVAANASRDKIKKDRPQQGQPIYIDNSLLVGNEYYRGVKKADPTASDFGKSGMFYDGLRSSPLVKSPTPPSGRDSGVSLDDSHDNTEGVKTSGEDGPSFYKVSGSKEGTTPFKDACTSCHPTTPNVYGAEAPFMKNAFGKHHGMSGNALFINNTIPT